MGDDEQRINRKGKWRKTRREMEKKKEEQKD